MDITYSYQTLALAACLLFAGYLSYRSWTPPSPPPARPYHQDVAGKWLKPSVINARRGIIIALWLYHTALTLTYPEPPTLLCPFPQNLSVSVFSWSRYVMVCLSVIFVAASIRFLAFAQLGTNFTFRLAVPTKLVRTGMYAYVRHPSYTSHFILLLANAALMSRPSGISGCWMPSAIVAWSEAFFPLLFILLACVLAFGLSLRVRDEEEMLKNEFGEEWEAYHMETKRFVPGLF